MSRQSLMRFIRAQDKMYDLALHEIRLGKKKSHWMWYIFPQLKGLGYSDLAQYYGIANLAEAEEYLHHSLLGPRLIAIAQTLLIQENTNAHEIFGSPDDLKLKSSMTLFSSVKNTDKVFEQVLSNFFNSTKDSKTLALLYPSFKT